MSEHPRLRQIPTRVDEYVSIQNTNVEIVHRPRLNQLANVHEYCSACIINVDKIYDSPKPYPTEYMIPKNRWDKIIRWRKSSVLEKKINCLAYYQYYLTQNILSECNIPNKLLHRKSYDDQDISIPHVDVEHIFRKHQKAAFSPLPKDILDRYKKLKELYDKIMSVEENEEKWIAALKEADDDAFVQQNVEFRLGNDILNKKLWKLYISYLKEKNLKIMLHTYSKYCRVFLDDIQMRKEYEKQVKIHGPIQVPWTNLFTPMEGIDYFQSIKTFITGKPAPPKPPQPSFEIHGDVVDIIHEYSQMCTNGKDKNLNILQKNVSKTALTIFFSKNGMIYQRYPFHSTIINYILKNANANLLQKLQTSCKELFSRQPTPVCYNLILQITSHPEKHISRLEESVIIDDSNPTAAVYDSGKLVISNRLCASSFHFPKMLSSFIPKIHRCDAKFLEIHGQKLTVQEFEFLTKNGTIEELILTKSSVIDKDDEMQQLPFEEIMNVVLSVRIVEVSNTNLYTCQTAEVLSELPFKNKILRFTLSDVNVELDPETFAQFTLKNAATNSKLKICFIHPVSGEFQRNFFKKINERIATKWECPDIRPIFTSSLL